MKWNLEFEKLGIRNPSPRIWNSTVQIPDAISVPDPPNNISILWHCFHFVIFQVGVIYQRVVHLLILYTMHQFPSCLACPVPGPILFNYTVQCSVLEPPQEGWIRVRETLVVLLSASSMEGKYDNYLLHDVISCFVASNYGYRAFVTMATAPIWKLYSFLDKIPYILASIYG